MSLRGRMTLLAAGAVALAVASATLVAYFATGRILRSDIDQQLMSRATISTQAQAGSFFTSATPISIPIGIDQVVRLDSLAQVIDSNGQLMMTMVGAPGLPIEPIDVEIAAGAPITIRTVQVLGQRYRMVTAPLPDGRALQLAISLVEAEAAVTGLRFVLFGVGLAGVVVAGGAGWLIARRSLRPIEDLTQAAETIASTQELSTRIAGPGKDEIGRLAASFNRMLDALEESRIRQHRLVTDASHEFRTPLTSLRTNVEMLARHDGDLAGDERLRIIDDIGFELAGLTSLAEELVDLATDPKASDRGTETFRLDQIASEVVNRERRRTGRSIELVTRSNGSIEGYPDLVARAIRNLIDNAHKWSPADAPLAVRVDGPRVAVRDHGPGIAVEDRPLVFERFYRSTAARSTPGSGLGLSIVKHVADQHGGSVFVEEGDDGGAVVGFELGSKTPFD